jgi:hypothetical protein
MLNDYEGFKLKILKLIGIDLSSYKERQKRYNKYCYKLFHKYTPFISM